MGHLTIMLLEESNISNCGTKFEEMENKEKEDLIEETPIFTIQKLAPKVIFKIPIATNAPLPFIHRFIKNEENKKEVLKTFEKEEISKYVNKQVLRYDFLQEFCTINGELKDNKSVSKRDNWFAIPQREFLLKPNDTFEVKRYHSDFQSYFIIDKSNFLGYKFFKFQGNYGREKSVEMPQKEQHVGDKCVNIIQRLTSLLVKVVHYVHPSLFKQHWG